MKAQEMGEPQNVKPRDFMCFLIALFGGAPATSVNAKNVERCPVVLAFQRIVRQFRPACATLSTKDSNSFRSSCNGKPHFVARHPAVSVSLQCTANNSQVEILNGGTVCHVAQSCGGLQFILRFSLDKCALFAYWSFHKEVDYPP
jgi:hypothetical protein